MTDQHGIELADPATAFKTRVATNLVGVGLSYQVAIEALRQEAVETTEQQKFAVIMMRQELEHVICMLMMFDKLQSSLPAEELEELIAKMEHNIDEGFGEFVGSFIMSEDNGVDTTQIMSQVISVAGLENVERLYSETQEEPEVSG